MSPPSPSRTCNALLVLLPLLVACGSSDVSPSPAEAGAGGGMPSDAGGSASESCSPSVAQHVPGPANHLTSCAPVTYDTNPPSGGEHYDDWAAFQTYAFAVPEGFLVHALEHGAVVIWYNCPDGCAAEVQRAQALLDAQAVDPLCARHGVERRAILTPSPELTTRWAASAWGWTLRADCFDEAAFGAFYADHYGRGPESLCNAGRVITAGACP